MGMKFLNKKGWHTGSLRNIENVWKAEQKFDQEQKKLEELRKQILEDREKSEFRALQEQAGLLPKQDRLEFLYESGLGVGKGSAASSSDTKGGGGAGFKALDEASIITNDNKQQQQPSSSAAAAPGALFEDSNKPYNANDAWRKLHSDPLLLIRQREQEAVARVKNNPVKMAMIRKSVEEKKHKEKKKSKSDKHKKIKHSRSTSKHHRHSSSSDSEDDHDVRRKKSSDHRREGLDERSYGKQKDDESSGRERSKKKQYKDSRDEIYDEDRSFKKREYDEPTEGGRSKKNDYKDSRDGTYDGDRSYKEREYDKTNERETSKRSHYSGSKDRNRAETRPDKYSSEVLSNSHTDKKDYQNSSTAPRQESSHNRRRNAAPKISEEERAARLREMQMDAELHEEQRWRRLKKAEQDDAKEATRDTLPGGKNFLDAAQKSIFGAEKGGHATIEESLRSRSYYSQRRPQASETNAFRR
ncbi:hypothetical protein ACFE04_029307 [Oxalis oulophora]